MLLWRKIVSKESLCLRERYQFCWLILRIALTEDVTEGAIRLRGIGIEKSQLR